MYYSSKLGDQHNKRLRHFKICCQVTSVSSSEISVIAKTVGQFKAVVPAREIYK